MDEAALRAMMPTSFGRRPGKKVDPSASATTTGSSSTTPRNGDGAHDLSSTLLGKRPATVQQHEEEEEDDGLTAEERAANREAERVEQERRAQGLDSDDDDDDSDSDNDSDIGPPPPPSQESSKAPSTTLPPLSLPPTSHSAHFTGTHSKTLSALAVDPSGSRFALGSYDFSLSLYDFGGLTSTLKPFRLFDPAESYPVLDLDFNASGSRLLVVSGTSEARVFTRDGAEVGRCKSGDPYLRDMRRTRGHVGGLTCGTWGRSGESIFTGGSDSTVRIWDVEVMERGQSDVIVLKSRVRGGRTKVTALAVEGDRLWASGLDGALGLWDLRGNLNGKPRASKEGAHEAESWTSSIAVHPGGEKVVSRGGDGTVKLWDMRQFREPVVERGGLENTSNHTSVIFDPFNSRTLLTGVADALPRFSNNDDDGGASSSGGGQLVTLDSHTLATVESLPLPTPPIRLHWAPATDQLFCTLRNSLTLFYTPTRSTNGITLAITRPTPTSRTSFYTSTSIPSSDSYPVYTPEEVGQSESAKRRRLAKDRADPLKTRMPQPPIEGRGRGGRIGAGEMQGVVRGIVGLPGDLGVDPREALLRYAKKDGEEEFTKAWKETQPKTLYSRYEEDE